jgi:hypothetical protein
MIRAAALLLALALASAQTRACPPPAPELLLHSCRTEARARAILLPEDPLPEPARPALVVTGAYTATDARAGGLAKPVGLFVHGGEVVNPNLARMDGILVIEPETGALRLHHRARVPLRAETFDLRELGERRAFAEAARRAGLSVLQSHLLVVDGRVDAQPVEGAPSAVRRLLFTDGAGYGLWQSPRPMTLHEAAEALAAAHAPRMALNLDMGGHDYCWRLAPDGARSCGLLGRGETGALSNLLAFEVAHRDASAR